MHGDYYLVRTAEDGRAICTYEGNKPAYDMSQFVPVPVSKGSSSYMIIIVNMFQLSEESKIVMWRI